MSSEQIWNYEKFADRADRGKPLMVLSTYPNPSEVYSGINYQEEP